MTESFSQQPQSGNEMPPAQSTQNTDEVLRAALVERYGRLYKPEQDGGSFAAYFDTATAWEGEGLLASLSKRLGRKSENYTRDVVFDAVDKAYESGGIVAVIEYLEA